MLQHVTVAPCYTALHNYVLVGQGLEIHGLEERVARIEETHFQVLDTVHRMEQMIAQMYHSQFGTNPAVPVFFPKPFQYSSPKNPVPPPTNIQHTTSSAAHQPFQYSSPKNPVPLPTNIQHTTSSAAHQPFQYSSPKNPVPPPTNIQHTTSSAAHQPFQYSSAPNPVAPPTDIQYTTTSAAHQPFQYSSAPNPVAPPTDIQYTTSPAHHIVASETPVIPNNSHQDPLSLSHTYSNKPLPSSSINKSELTSVDYVMKTNKAKSCKPSTLTQLLARNAFFGESLMAVCTPSGTKDLLALPKHEMFELKKAVFRAFPKYSPESFEIEWRRKCWTAIKQACGRLRRSAR